MTKNKNHLDRFAQHSGNLFSLPTVAMEVLELTKDETIDAKLLKACIENDPAMTIKLLKVVNSSLFGLSGEVSDLNQALALLGCKPLKLLVLGFSLPSALFLNVAGNVLERYWRHTLTKAVAARQFSTYVWKQNGDEAFIASLLSEIGLLTLVQELGEPYVKFLTKVYDQTEDIAALEQESLGFTHHQLTARMLDQWKLPNRIVQAIDSTNQPEKIDTLKEQDQDLAKIVHLSELLTLIVASGRNELMPELMKYAEQYQQINIEQLNNIASGLSQQVQQLAEILSLELSEAENSQSITELAHQQLALIAEEVAADVVRADRSRLQSQKMVSQIAEEDETLTDAVAEFLDHGMNNSEQQSLVDKNTDALIAQFNGTDNSHRTSDGSQVSQSETVVCVDTGVNQLVEQRLAAALAQSRQSRTPLSLALVELEFRDDDRSQPNIMALQHGHKILNALCQRVDHPAAEQIEARTSQIVLILPDCDRPTAKEIAQQLLRDARGISLESLNLCGSCKLSIGLSILNTTPKDFPATEIIESAERCLFAAKSSGGDAVKSINVL